MRQSLETTVGGIRAKISALGHGEAIIRFVRGTGRLIDPLQENLIGHPFPASELSVVVIRSDACVDVARAIVHDGYVHIGGPSWFYRERKYQGGVQTVYTRNAKDAKPVGVRRCLSAETQPGLVFWPTRSDQILLSRCSEMSERIDQDMAVSSDEVLLPRFLQPMTPGHVLRLRGDVADPQHPIHDHVMHTAQTGEWCLRYVPNGVAAERGLAFYKDAKTVLLKQDLHESESLNDLNELQSSGSSWHVEDGKFVEEYRCPTAESVEAALFDTFGVCLPVSLYPAKPVGSKVMVRPEQALFVPVPVRAWTKTELFSRPDYATLVYMSVLKTVAEFEGRVTVDYSWALGHAEPLVLLADASVCQRIRFIKRVDGHWLSVPDSFKKREGGVDFNLRVTTLRSKPAWMIAKERAAAPSAPIKTQLIRPTVDSGAALMSRLVSTTEKVKSISTEPTPDDKVLVETPELSSLHQG